VRPMNDAGTRKSCNLEPRDIGCESCAAMKGEQMRMIAMAFLAFAAFSMATPVEARPQTRPSDGGAMWRWIAQPNMLEVSQAAHDTISSPIAEGEWAVMDCVIDDGRRLDDCAIIEETAPDAGIGDCLMRLAHHYRAASRDSAGQSPVGRRVRLSMGFGGWSVP